MKRLLAGIFFVAMMLGHRIFAIAEKAVQKKAVQKEWLELSIIPPLGVGTALVAIFWFLGFAVACYVLSQANISAIKRSESDISEAVEAQWAVEWKRWFYRMLYAFIMMFPIVWIGRNFDLIADRIAARPLAFGTNGIGHIGFAVLVTALFLLAQRWWLNKPFEDLVEVLKRRGELQQHYEEIEKLKTEVLNIKNSVQNKQNKQEEPEQNRLLNPPPTPPPQDPPTPKNPQESDEKDKRIKELEVKLQELQKKLDNALANPVIPSLPDDQGKQKEKLEALARVLKFLIGESFYGDYEVPLALQEMVLQKEGFTNQNVWQSLYQKIESGKRPTAVYSNNAETLKMIIEQTAIPLDLKKTLFDVCDINTARAAVYLLCLMMRARGNNP